ncbi:hypothetical protein [Vibrio hepatarius]|uniref:hypothetical protein n=1 Tax=Vibrio hepatarius TaxID=171383 RepID=UPI001C0828FD|nr:hypothetical protein [Vibrio hepatarius]MBU2896417.1 hypothetical protein [Vibrio hepatarius]
MEENKPDLKSELEHHYEFSYPFPPRYHDCYWSDANMTYDEALIAFHAQTEQEQHMRRNPVNRDRLKRPVGSSPDDKGYPFSPRHSMTWDNNEYGISYDEAVALYEHGKAKLPNPRIAYNPLISVTPKTPQGSRLAVQAMNEEVAKQKAEQAAQKVLTAQTQTAQTSTPVINPNNAYWPPYNFLAKEGEKEIHVRYTQDVVEATVLAPEEWKEFFDVLDKTQNIGGAMKGTYDAFDTAKKLGGLGVTAYVKTHNGVDYLILKGYKQHMKTLLAGHRFKASNPQVVKLGLGALDSVKGMARYVKVTAPMEILVGSAINVLQYVLNDEYTLKQLGIDEAKLLVGVLSSTALAGGILGVLAVASIPVTFLAGTIIIIGSSFAVWTIDKTTDFQNKIVEGAIESFN